MASLLFSARALAVLRAARRAARKRGDRLAEAFPEADDAPVSPRQVSDISTGRLTGLGVVGRGVEGVRRILTPPGGDRGEVVLVLVFGEAMGQASGHQPCQRYIVDFPWMTKNKATGRKEGGG